MLNYCFNLRREGQKNNWNPFVFYRIVLMWSRLPEVKSRPSQKWNDDSVQLAPPTAWAPQHLNQGLVSQTGPIMSFVKIDWVNLGGHSGSESYHWLSNHLIWIQGQTTEAAEHEAAGPQLMTCSSFDNKTGCIHCSKFTNYISMARWWELIHYNLCG